ncbi:N-acetylmuramoyl-L-alanine amidase [Oceanicola sp. 502str15]|uniref:N-acetylmuramoyl-L-alanine amidase n=1 Tax=Oceanicola sp. 502str15 TaxID=2696061 RepID=UPI0020960989|nr:N-acetylmuramoyl-L-alanine amidase [Oceanicola sp. 502str15]MCO6382566.1 AMIN domain-containing protein [Oceanicola sp. 502str15]
MRAALTIIFAALCCAILASAATAQGFSGLARVDPARSGLEESGQGVTLRLTISQPVAYRVRLLADPPRLVVDFREVDFAPLGTPDLATMETVTALRTGRVGPGWTRLVAELAAPLGLDTAQMITGAADGSARVEVVLAPVSEAEFAAQVARGQGGSEAFPAPSASTPAKRRPAPGGKLVVVLDPGHGGVDPGATRDGITEADLMLTFARDVREALLRAGDYEVVMTREDDSFVSLETRLTIARRAGAGLFLSLHADAVEEGIARGAQVYTLSDEASSEALAKLAYRHDRDDILGGADLSGTDDAVAQALLEIARRETAPRTMALARAMVGGLRGKGVRLHKHALGSADFSVLKLPDIPAVLLEAAFLSTTSELEKLQKPEWRAQAAEGIAQGVAAWAAEDARLKALIRQ